MAYLGWMFFSGSYICSAKKQRGLMSWTFHEVVGVYK